MGTNFATECTAGAGTLIAVSRRTGRVGLVIAVDAGRFVKGRQFLAGYETRNEVIR